MNNDQLAINNTHLLTLRRIDRIDRMHHHHPNTKPLDEH